LPALPRRWRGWLVGAAVTLVGLIGLSRIVLGVHFVSDVVGAWCLGVTWLGLSVYAFELYRSHTGRPVPQPLTEGLEPEAAADVAPAVHERTAGPGILRTLGLLAIAWVFILGTLAGL